MNWRRALFACAVLAPLHASAVEVSWQVCAQAGVLAERQFGIPDGLLLAVGRTESGRTSPDGAVAAWPWTINAAGTGRYLADQAQAVTTVQTLLASGTASIDVGCYQVNLQQHPAAFASLEEAFDPTANATYAARFLKALFSREGSWEAAVAAYHSMTPAHGLPYRDRVFAGWSGSVPAQPVLVAFGVKVVTPATAGTAPGVIVLRPVGGLPALVRGRS
jgi:hypothetical protein